MAKHGSLGEFSLAHGDWKSYIERAKQYFPAYDVTDEGKQQAILLSTCGDATYRRIKDVLSPTAPADASFKMIVDKMTMHLQPTPSEIVERCRFHSHKRLAGESVATFIAHLKQIAEYCNFGDAAQLEVMLRDRLVCGIANDKWQQRLLAEGDSLTYAKALKLLLALEAAEQQAKDIATDKPPTSTVNQLCPPRRPHGKPTASAPTTPQSKACYCCGGAHDQTKCHFRNEECHYCHKKGHIASVCRQKAKKQQARTKAMHAVAQSGDLEYPMHIVDSPPSKPISVQICLNGTPIDMEMDTGATVSIMSKHTYQSLWPKLAAPSIQPSTARLCTYTGESLDVIGSIDVKVEHKGQEAALSLIIVDGDGPTLLGREWLRNFTNWDWAQMNTVNTDPASKVETILARHADLFNPGLGKVDGITAKFYLKPDAHPRFCRARPVPYAIRDKIEQKIDRLVETGVIEPVNLSEWATPIAPIVKSDGSIHLCGDYKVTLNRETLTESYPLPRIEDMLASLAGGTLFSKVDLAHAYQQIVLDDDSKKMATTTTHKGLYRVNRLPFGVASAPSLFQRIMETMLQGLPSVVVYIDDILVTENQ